MSNDRIARARAALTDEWRALRDDARYYDCAAAVVRYAHRAGLIDSSEQELWLRRLTTCPGHDDEGGRSWCAFCGDMEKGGDDTRPTPQTVRDAATEPRIADAAMVERCVEATHDVPYGRSETQTRDMMVRAALRAAGFEVRE